jgi:hypothetical protein
MIQNKKIAERFSLLEDIVLYPGDCLDLLQGIPDESLTLVITSPENTHYEYQRIHYRSATNLCYRSNTTAGR